MLVQAGRYFFRTRNALFPIVMAALVIAFRARGFGDPVSDTLAVVGVVLALAGQTIRVITVGLDYVKRGGKKKQIYAARLVTGGIYAHTRNPMYVGNLLVVIGLLLVVGNPWGIAIGVAFFTFAYVAITAGEEAYLAKEFGDAYRAYCAQTPRWLPRPWRLLGTIRAYRFDWPAVIVKEYGTIFTTLFFLTAALAWKAGISGQLERFAPLFIAATVTWMAFFVVARYLKKGRGLLARGVTMSTGGLVERRKRIDDIDNALLDLMNRRAAEVSAIYEWKQSANIGRVDPDRIEAIIVRLQERNVGPLTDDQVRRLFGGMLFHFSHEHGRAADDQTPATSDAAATASPVDAKPQ